MAAPVEVLAPPPNGFAARPSPGPAVANVAEVLVPPSNGFAARPSPGAAVANAVEVLVPPPTGFVARPSPGATVAKVVVGDSLRDRHQVVAKVRSQCATCTWHMCVRDPAPRGTLVEHNMRRASYGVGNPSTKWQKGKRGDRRGGGALCKAILAFGSRGYVHHVGRAPDRFATTRFA